MSSLHQESDRAPRNSKVKDSLHGNRFVDLETARITIAAQRAAEAITTNKKNEADTRTDGVSMNDILWYSNELPALRKGKGQRTRSFIYRVPYFFYGGAIDKGKNGGIMPAP